MNGKIPVYNNYAIVTANVVLTKPQNKIFSSCWEFINKLKVKYQ